MKRRSFYKDVIAVLKDGCKVLQEIETKKTQLRNKIDSKQFSQIAINSMREEIDSLKKQSTVETEKHLKKLNKLIQEMRVSLDEEMELRGSDITEDAELLKFNLSADELISIINRHRDNPTMIQLCLKNAKDRGIRLGIYFTGNEEEMAVLNSMENSASVVLKYPDKESILDELFGEGSVVATTFDSDDLNRSASLAYSDERVANAARLLKDNLLSPATQQNIINEFKDYPGILPILRNAAIEGGNSEAGDLASRLILFENNGEAENR